MAQLTIPKDNWSNKEAEPEEITQLVNHYGSDQWYSSGELETLRGDIRSTREILGRLIDTIAERRLLSDDELVKIIRGW